MRKTLKIIKIVLLSYLVYFLVFGVLIFKIPHYQKSNLNYDTELMKTTSLDDNYAHIVETPQEALDIRLALINEATTSVNLVYYNFYSDTIGQILTGLLLKKANDGVKVNIIIDNKFFIKTKMMKTLATHPNINLYLYEKKNFLLPYSFQNSLHDKIITIDDRYGLIGGRNILDRFFFKDSLNEINDRDVLVFSKTTNNQAVFEMKSYIEELISSKMTKLVKARNKNYKNIYYDLYLKYLNEDYNFNEVIDNSVKVDNITFIRSPINRLNKEPVLFNVIKELAKDSDKLIIQSPYIVNSRMMKKDFIAPHENITFITNSFSNNPNMFAASGYLRIRNKLAKDYTVYEIQSKIGNHAKAVLIDDDISIIGSQNIDPRSFYLSTESAVVIYSQEFNSLLNEKFTDLIDNSLIVNEKGKYLENDQVSEKPLSPFKKFLLYLISGITAPFNEMLVNISYPKLF